MFLLLVVAASAQPFTFTKVADYSTAVPNGTGNFASFSNMVSVDASGNVAFHENNGTTNNGIYYYSGGTLARAADLHTAIPSGTGNFTAFSFFGNGLDAGRLVFRGNGSSSQAGLYSFSAGTLTTIANTGTAIPGGTGNFTGYGTGYALGSDTAFIASGSSGQQGVYVSDGTTLSLIANTTNTVPGIGGTYGWSSQLSFDSGNIVFGAFATGGTHPGSFIGGYNGTSLVTLASLGTAVPGVGTNFTNFNNPPAVDGNTVAFQGVYAGGSGVFLTDMTGGSLSALATTATLAPGQAATFTSFATPVVENGITAFGANFTGGKGIYYYSADALAKIIDTGDLLDGKTLSGVSLFDTGFNGDYLAFRADFTDGTRGVYYTEFAAVPEPSTWAACAGLAGLGLAFWRRRRPA